MNDFHGASLTQYIIETTAVLVFGALFAVVGATFVIFPNASLAYRMRQYLRAQASSRQNALLRFFMLFAPAPTIVDTRLFGGVSLVLGLLFIYLGIEGIENLARS